MNNSSNLPYLSTDDLALGVFANNWEGIYNSLSGQCYERLGVDRLLLIVEDIWQECTSLSGVRILDVGCNNGLFGRALTMLGCDAIRY